MVRVSYWMLLACVVTVGCGGSSSPTAPSVNVPYSQTDIVVGSGAEATNGRTVTVRYAGWLYDPSAAANKGTQFDAGTLPPFVVGGGTLIQGFERGVLGMRLGGKRLVVIPPSLGYGSQGSPPRIPANATLIFELELLTVQ